MNAGSTDQMIQFAGINLYQPLKQRWFIELDKPPIGHSDEFKCQ
jgi:hypothetical protein